MDIQSIIIIFFFSGTRTQIMTLPKINFKTYIFRRKYRRKNCRGHQIRSYMIQTLTRLMELVQIESDLFLFWYLNFTILLSHFLFQDVDVRFVRIDANGQQIPNLILQNRNFIDMTNRLSNSRFY